MGGNLFKNNKTERYNTDEIIPIGKFMCDSINKVTDSKVSVVRFYNKKETHGDLDLIISLGNSDQRTLIEKIKRRFHISTACTNGQVFSFVFYTLQVDCIFVQEKYYEMARVYYAYNDMGMLIGRMSHSLGLNYGHEGLKMRTYSDDKSYRFPDIQLSYDPNEIFIFLDLDLDRHEKGFDTWDDIFEFIATSKYFTVDVFDDKLIRSCDRRRDNKRPSIHIFNRWLEKNKDRFGNKFTKLTQDQKITFTDVYFPKLNIKDQYQKYIDIYNSKLLAKEKFNGHLIMEWCPEFVQSKKLGDLIREFKRHINNQKLTWLNYLITHDKMEIKNDFLLFLRNK